MTLTCLLSISMNSFGMEQTKNSSDGLSKEESDCFEWFEGYKQESNSVFQSMPDNERKFLHAGIHSQEDPQVIQQVIIKFVSKLYENFSQVNIPVKYTEKILVSTLLKIRIATYNQTVEKPTDLVTARIYVASQLLTKTEKDAVSKDNFLTNSDNVSNTLKRYSTLLAEELAKLGLIGCTEHDKSKCAQYWYERKMKDVQMIHQESNWKAILLVNHN